MAGNGWNDKPWLLMAGHGSKLLEMALMAGNGWIMPENGMNGWKLLEMAEIGGNF